jgi:hypothetical protein
MIPSEAKLETRLGWMAQESESADRGSRIPRVRGRFDLGSDTGHLSA